MIQRLARAACAWAVLAGCASAPPPPSPRELPGDRDERHRVLASFGERLYSAIASGEPEAVMADDGAREALLKPEVVRRVNRERAASRQAKPAIAPSDRQLWRSARYEGLCVQSGRLELPAGAVGLRRAGFVFERGLLIGREPAGGQLAGWVEGVFVLTQAGFIALEIERIEGPRRDHSDLELAECELADRPGTPQDVVSGGKAIH